MKYTNNINILIIISTLDRFKASVFNYCPFFCLEVAVLSHLILSICNPSPDLSDALLQMQPSDVLDMPVDPNEPTYCLCHQVSYGEMIGCDNPDVSFRNLDLWCPYFGNTLKNGKSNISRTSWLHIVQLIMFSMCIFSVQLSGFTLLVLISLQSQRENGKLLTYIFDGLHFWPCSENWKSFSLYEFLNGFINLSSSFRFCPRCTQDKKKKWDFIYYFSNYVCWRSWIV